MYPTTFQQANKTLLPPQGVSEEECGRLPIYTDGRFCMSRWEPTPEELQQLVAGAPLWVTVWSGDASQPPIDLSPADPWSGPTGRLREQPLPGSVLSQLSFLAKQAQTAGLDHLALALTDLHLLQVSGLADVAAGTLREVTEPIWKAAEAGEITGLVPPLPDPGEIPS